jgi:hypothetical protein
LPLSSRLSFPTCLTALELSHNAISMEGVGFVVHGCLVQCEPALWANYSFSIYIFEVMGFAELDALDSFMVLDLV